jgi:hypothetical protein
MKKIIIVSIVLLLNVALFAQVPSYVIANHQRVNLFCLSLNDIGFDKKIVATNYEIIRRKAEEQGYKVCTPEVATILYDTFHDRSNAYDIHAPHWLTICTQMRVYRFGDASNGRFMELSDYNTWCVPLDTYQKFLIFTK